MNSSELEFVLSLVVDKRYWWEELNPEQQQKTQAFLTLIGVEEDDYLDANTCDHAYGCDLIEPLPYRGLIDGKRHVISSELIYFSTDSMETHTQLLVRTAPIAVPEPASALLLLAGLFLLVIQKKKYI
jgi:hypothetical protein